MDFSNLNITGDLLAIIIIAVVVIGAVIFFLMCRWK